jgi:Alpha-glutamyl/putrescinyl thymine pyrophosphorylase clade 2
VTGRYGTWTDRMPDYVRFHAMELASGDVDPVYRVLDRLSASMPQREMALLSFLHVAFYDLGSALQAWGMCGGQANPRAVDSLISLPCGTERRGMRDKPELRKHLTALFEIDAAFDGLHRWAERFHTYGELFGALQGIYGNGRWAAYKSAELLSWSLRPYQINATQWTPTDMGHAHSSGPRQGLELLWAGAPLPSGHTAQAVRRLDAVSEELVFYLHQQGVRASQATAETTLCDFNSLVRGRYYPGHDIHQMGDQLRRAWRRVELTKLGLGQGAVRMGFTAATEEFGDEVLRSVDKDRKKIYKATGKLT